MCLCEISTVNYVVKNKTSTMKSIIKLISITLIIPFFSVISQAQPTADDFNNRVNVTTSNTQTNPAIAVDSAGRFVAVWESYGQDGDGWGVYAQRFNVEGEADGIPIRVNSTTTGHQRFPDVAMTKHGNFTVVYQSEDGDADGYGIITAEFDVDGIQQGNATVVNTTTSGHQMRPKIAMNGNGRGVVTWTTADADGYGIYARELLGNVNFFGNDFQVNTTTSSAQNYPDVASIYDDEATFEYVITWQSHNQDGSGNGVYFQRYQFGGSAQGSETLANTTTSDHQQAPSVSMDFDGDFVIVWESYGQDAANTTGIYGQRYSSDGSTNGSEFRVNTTTSSHQSEPNVSMDIYGNFVVVWASYGQDGDAYGVYLQAYKNDGSTNGNEILVNNTTSDFSHKPVAAMHYDSSRLRIVWQDGVFNGTPTSSLDGDDYGIYTQKYSLSGMLPVELLAFTGQAIEHQVLLEWQTATEINNSHFDVEWSTDGINFAPNASSGSWKKIGEVAGAGTTTESQFYEFIHKNPVNGNNYYRLRQVDLPAGQAGLPIGQAFNGGFEYTNIIQIIIEVSNSQAVKVYPNPASNYLIIESDSDNYQGDEKIIQIFNLRGQVMVELQRQKDLTHLSIASLPSGIYLLKVGDDVQKLIIETH